MGTDGEYGALAEEIAGAFNREFLNGGGVSYSKGSQACSLMPLYLGIAPENCRGGLIRALMEDIARRGFHASTGNICTKYLFEVLSDEGYADTALKVATRTDYPSLGYMISRGATTIWERWEDNRSAAMNSHNHPMYGSIGTWFYKYLCGIRPDPEKPGFENVIIKPYVPDGLSFAEGVLNTHRGQVSSFWKKTDGAFLLCVTVPCGSTAEIHVPLLQTAPDRAMVFEGGEAIWGAGGLTENEREIFSGHPENGYIRFQTGSGSFHFVVREGDA